MKDLAIKTGVGVTSVLGGFVGQALDAIAIWLVVMFWVVIADLCAGVFKCYKTEVEIRFSKGMRDTMAKLATYFAFVVAVVFVGEAALIPDITRWACLAVIIGEAISTASNMLKAHGYELNVNAVIKAVLNKVNIETDENLIKKQEDETETKKNSKA